MPDTLCSFTRSSAFFASLALHVLVFLLAVPRCPTLKQRAWILTALSSVVMSLASLPLCWDYLVVAHGHLAAVPRPNMWTYTSSRFFQAYLVADLAMGLFYYRSRMNILTGWIHHSIYVFIVEYAVRKNWTHIFCLCAIMEVPTFILAIGSLRPRLRSDVLFASTFFLTRIVLHLALAVSLVTARAEISAGSLGPSIIMVCVFPLHAFWFAGCLKGFRARMRTKTRPASAPEHHVSLPPQHLHGKPDPASSVELTRRDALVLATGSSQRSPRGSGFVRRRPASATALRLAVRARWDQLTRSRAGRHLGEVRRRLGAVLPMRALAYDYVGIQPDVTDAGGVWEEPYVAGLPANEQTRL